MAVIILSVSIASEGGDQLMIRELLSSIIELVQFVEETVIL